MYKYILFSVVLFCQLFSGYKVGEKISISDQIKVSIANYAMIINIGIILRSNNVDLAPWVAIIKRAYGSELF